MAKRSSFHFKLFSAFLAGLATSPSALAVSHSVSYGLDASDLVDALVGNAGITIVGAPTLTGFSGALGNSEVYTSGTFLTTGPNSGIPFNQGVIMATGDIRNSFGSNNDVGISTCIDAPGSVLLESVLGLGNLTHDAVSLSFQFKSATPTISLRYMFGSEEYNELFQGEYNDAFAFILQGPGNSIVNLSQVPATTTDVLLSTVNGSSNSNYFFDNNSGSYDLQYNGLAGSASSDALYARGNVEVDEIYTLSIIIADVNDVSFDSALFVEAGSFVAEGFTEGALPVPEASTLVGGAVLGLIAAVRLIRNKK